MPGSRKGKAHCTDGEVCCCSASWVLLEFFLLTLQGPAPNTLHYGRPFILISRGERERGKHGAISGQSQRVYLTSVSGLLDTETPFVTASMAALVTESQ